MNPPAHGRGVFFAAKLAQPARQLHSQHLTEDALRVLNRTHAKKNLLEVFRKRENFVLVCRTDPAY